LEDIAIKMALCTMLLYNLYIAVVLGVIERNRNIFRFCSFSHNLAPKEIIWPQKRILKTIIEHPPLPLDKVVRMNYNSNKKKYREVEP